MAILQDVQKQYEAFKAQNLKLDMSRGKPCKEQLALSDDLDGILKGNYYSQKGEDCRNYGNPAGIAEARELCAQILDVPSNQVLVGGNSSLNLMSDIIKRAMLKGIMGNTPWCKLPKVKFICPVPGYDRHFGLCENAGIEMINVPMTNEGPDMDEVERLVKDGCVKGIWCVPKYSNPDGISYSDETVKRFAALKPAAADFRIFWDNAYCVHHFDINNPDKILNIYEECTKQGNEDLVYIFASTSKVTFAGAGIAAVGASPVNFKEILDAAKVQTIGYDKVNQLRHARFFGNLDSVLAHMEKHAQIVKPKFDLVLRILQGELTDGSFASWSKPNGGYFISVFVKKGTAKRVCALCKEAGVTLTGAGATYPYGKDPDDSNIRIAPTFPPLEELEVSMRLFCTCVKLAYLEK